MARSKMRPSRNNSARGDSTQYRGPVRLPTQAGLDSRSVRQNMSYSYEATSDSSGIMAGAVTGADVTGCSDWSSFANVYQEARVLGIEFHYSPYYNGNLNGTRDPSVGAACVKHVPLIASPTSVDSVVQVTTWKAFRSASTIRLTYKMRGFEEGQYSGTGTPSNLNHGGVEWYIPNLNANQPYGRFVITFLVEFRGRK